MSKPEFNVLLRVLHEGSIRRAIALGLDQKLFSDPIALVAFNQIVKHSQHQANRGKTPTLAYMKTLCPKFPVEAECPEETLPELVETVRQTSLRRSLSQIMIDMDDFLHNYNTPDIALQHLIASARLLGHSSSAPSHLQMDLAEAMEKLRDEYDLVANGQGLRGLSLPWEPLNRALGGLVNGTLTVLYAPSKHGKTWMSLEMAVIHPFVVHNARCLIISCEMPVMQIYRRIAARLARVDYSGVVSGTLEARERDLYFEILRNLEQEQQEIVISGQEAKHKNIRCIRPSARSGASVEAIRKEIEAFQPDIVYVDSVYRLQDAKGARDMKWNSVGEILRDLKDLTGEYNLPILATTQANRSGWGGVEDIDFDSYGDIGMSSSIIHEADAVVRIHKFRLPDNSSRILFTTPALRESGDCNFLVRFNPTVDFGLDHPEVTQEHIKALMASAVVQQQGYLEEESEPATPSFMPSRPVLSFDDGD